MSAPIVIGATPGRDQAIDLFVSVTTSRSQIRPGANPFYDEMVVFVALGAALVLMADLASALVRRTLRRAG